MKKPLLWLASILLLLGSVPSVLADKTNVWPFTSAAQYEVSNSNDIEVADGVAKLKLQAAVIADVDVNQFLDSTAVRQSLVVGPDVLLSLSRRSDSTYQNQGALTSRVLDGGAGGGNRWDSLSIKAYNTTLLNAAGESSASDGSLILLCHMNNDWVNSMNGTIGVPGGSPSFSSAAKLGSAAGVFKQGNDFVGYDGLTGFSNAISIAYWVNASNTAGFYPISVAAFNGGTIVAYLRCGGNYNDWGNFNLQFIVSAGVAATSTGTFGPADEHAWHHIVVTYDGSLASGSRVRFFKDGVELAKIHDATLSPWPTTTRLNVGGRGAGGQGMEGLMDEVAVFARALTPQEVVQLFNSPRSYVVQCRSGNTTDELQMKAFVGPDGTAASTYGGPVLGLQNSATFSRVDRFLQYQLTLLGQSDGMQTPFVDAIGVVGARVSVFDNVLGDFDQATGMTGLQVVPLETGAVGVGLNKKPNGGYYGTGAFISRVFDAGASVYWDTLNWSRSSELTINEGGLLGLWHMDGGWSDGSGHGYNGSNISNMNFTPYAKLGSQSAVFNGTSSSVDFVFGSNKVGAVEFWMNSQNVSGGIMDLGSGCVIRFTQRLLKAEGFPGTAPQIFINGQANTPFLPLGWNHVAVILPSGLISSNLTVTVGRAGTEYYDGQLDELALYDTVKDGGSVKTHYLMGGRSSAGSIRFQVRASDTFPISEQQSNGLFHSHRVRLAVRCMAETVFSVRDVLGWRWQCVSVR